MLQVADVAAASEWYQRTLGFVSGHGGDEFEMLYAGEPYASPLLLQLHRWEAHEHGFLGSPDVPVGNGVVAVVPGRRPGRARAASGSGRAAARDHVLAEPAWNPLAHHHEFSMRDPDGYVVAVHTPFANEP